MIVILEKDKYRYIKHEHESQMRVQKRDIYGETWLDKYSIFIDGSGFMACTCPGFKFHAKQCKHVKTAAPAIAEFNNKIQQVKLEKVDMFALWNQIEILIQEGYRKIYVNDISNLRKAEKWVGDMRKKMPLQAPWSSKATCTVEELIAIKKEIETELNNFAP